MNWVKLHTSLLHSQRWRRLSEAGKTVFPSLLMLVGREEEPAGALRGGIGPYSVDEIASETGLSAKTVRRGLTDCEGVGLLARAADGAYVIEKWAEKAGESSRERTRKYRGKDRHGDVGVTSQGGHGDDAGCHGDGLDKIREEVEGDKNLAPLGMGAHEADPSEPLGDDELDLPATARTTADRAAVQAADDFGAWFHREGRARGAIGGHVTYPGTLGDADLLHVMALLAAHGRPAVEAVAAGMFAWAADPVDPMRMPVSLVNLHGHFDTLRRRAPVRPAEPELTDIGRRYAALKAVGRA